VRNWDIEFNVMVGPKTRSKWDKNEIVWGQPAMRTWTPGPNCSGIDRVDHYCKECISVPLSYHTGFTILISTCVQISLYYERYVGDPYD